MNATVLEVLCPDWMMPTVLRCVALSGLPVLKEMLCTVV